MKGYETPEKDKPHFDDRVGRMKGSDEENWRKTLVVKVTSNDSYWSNEENW